MVKAVVITRDPEIKKLAIGAAEGLNLKIAGSCQSVKEAIAVFRAEPVKIVILDMFLGDSSALDAIKALKKIDETLSLIVLSRMSGRALLERLFRLGAGDILPYPCELETLRQTFAHRLDRIGDGMVSFHE